MSKPARLRIEYLARADDNTLICVTTDDRYDYRFFIGAGSPLREVAITRFDRYRDGGTTYITTSEGEFYVPRPQGRNPHSARYRNTAVTLMDHAGTDVELTSRDDLILC